ncbi:TrmH family RNA methyltransferase, partial [Mycolicibacterium gadium]|uniref:TrmH family RNA methyltransferase n=1 Tax=Mycolicibacterium gadium TaxID=1794 RepID=UPI0023E15C61
TDPVLAAPTAWVFGPESQGLSADVAALADHRVRIPMAGGAESLSRPPGEDPDGWRRRKSQRGGGNSCTMAE